MSTQDLTNASTAVFYGKCSKKSCDWDKNHRIIYTYVTVTPEVYIKGNLGADQLLQFPEDRWGILFMKCSDMPEFYCGRRDSGFCPDKSCR